MEESTTPPPETPKPDPDASGSPMSSFYKRHDPVVLERLKREWEAAREELRKYF